MKDMGKLNVDPAHMLLVGVDGGGTKTMAKVYQVDENYRLATCLATCETGSANANSVGIDKATEHVERAISQALSKAVKAMRGEPDIQVLSICLSTAGVDREGDEIPFKKKLEHIRVGNYQNQDIVINIVNDAYAALASGVLCDGAKTSLEGIVLIVGTGTIAFGVREDKTLRAAGWGPAFGDFGSGYDISQKALTAVARSHDGRGPPTELTPLILEHLNLKTADELIGWAYSNQDWASIASLAPVVFKADSNGDGVAGEILLLCAQELFNSVKAVWSRLWHVDEQPSVDIVLAGGIMSSNASLVKTVKDLLTKGLPKCTIIQPEADAGDGAAMIALTMLKKKISSRAS